jgi:hypothetical protein
MSFLIAFKSSFFEAAFHSWHLVLQFRNEDGNLFLLRNLFIRPSDCTILECIAVK